MSRRRVPAEHDEAVALIAWRDTLAPHFPELRRLLAIPNAGAGSQRGQAGKMKAEGAVSGVPDYFLPVPKWPAHGLWLELKNARGGKGLSEAQRWWVTELVKAGYVVHVEHGWAAAACAIGRYLGLPRAVLP